MTSVMRSDGDYEKYQLEDYKLIQYQILRSNIIKIAWQTVRRITNKILGVKGLRTDGQYGLNKTFNDLYFRRQIPKTNREIKT